MLLKDQRAVPPAPSALSSAPRTLEETLVVDVPSDQRHDACVQGFRAEECQGRDEDR